MGAQNQPSIVWRDQTRTSSSFHSVCGKLVDKGVLTLLAWGGGVALLELHSERTVVGCWFHSTVYTRSSESNNHGATGCLGLLCSFAEWRTTTKAASPMDDGVGIRKRSGSHSSKAENLIKRENFRNEIPHFRRRFVGCCLGYRCTLLAVTYGWVGYRWRRAFWLCPSGMSLERNWKSTVQNVFFGVQRRIIWVFNCWLAQRTSLSYLIKFIRYIPWYSSSVPYFL